jgi:flagellar biosynthesis GTPase FlhF
VREALGEDAVIVSNRITLGGVEVIAALVPAAQPAGNVTACGDAGAAAVDPAAPECCPPKATPCCSELHVDARHDRGTARRHAPGTSSSGATRCAGTCCALLLGAGFSTRLAGASCCMPCPPA